MMMAAECTTAGARLALVCCSFLAPTVSSSVYRDQCSTAPLVQTRFCYFDIAAMLTRSPSTPKSRPYRATVYTAYISIKNTKLLNFYLIIFNADTFMPYRARSSEFLHFTR